VTPGPSGPPDRLPLALLLPGQGAQHAAMALGLVRTEPVVADVVDEVLDLFGAEGARIRRDWWAGAPVDDVTRAQPLLFAVDLALGRLLASRGVRPDVLVGHSAGEWAAAVLAGVVALPDAVRLLAERVEVLAGEPPGGMVAVAADALTVEAHLGGHEGVVVGAVNARDQVLVTGPHPQLRRAADALAAAGLTVLAARSTVGFHSPSLAAACARTLPSFARTRFAPPTVEVLSPFVGGPLGAEQACDPGFWAAQPAAPVLFGPVVDQLLARGPHVVVECGPGRSLGTLLRRHPARGRTVVTGLLPARPGGAAADVEALHRALDVLAGTGHLPVPRPHLEATP
jgi:acyl transferase domain-containing protein